MTLALNIKNEHVERLASEVAEMMGETKTEAIRRALAERRARLAPEMAGGDRRARLLRFLETELWPDVPESERGRVLTPEEEETILGYGAEGV